MKTIKYYQAPKENYTIVPNGIIQSQDLSDGAKILALYLLSLPKDWNICWEHIAKTLKKSLSSIKKYKSELVAFDFLKIEQLKDEKGRFLDKTCLFFSLFENHTKCDSNPLRNTTAYGSDDHIQNKKYKQNKEIIITQQTHLFHTLLESFAKIKNHKEQAKEKLEDFLNGAELEAGKEWVAYRKERFKIPASATIKKLRSAKEKGWDIVKSVERCITNDYRGLFECKARENYKPKQNKQNPQAQAQEKEILGELLKQGWRYGDNLEGLLVFGKKVTQKDGRFFYAL